MPDAAVLSLGLKPTNFEAGARVVHGTMAGLEKKWVGLGKTFGSVNREMLREQQSLFSALDRLTEVQQRGQLERLAGFQPEIILQREILGLRQSIAHIEGTTTQKIELQIQLEQKVLELEKMIAIEAERAAAAKEAAAAVTARDAARDRGGKDGPAEKPGDIERALQRKFGLNDAFKGLLMGVGIGSVQAIADALVKPFKSSADSAEKIADYTEKSVAATRALLDLRLTDALKIKQLETEIAREAREAMKAPTVEIGLWRRALGYLLDPLDLVGVRTKVIGEETARQAAMTEQRAKTAAAIEEKSVEIARLKNAELAKAAALAETRRIDALAELSSGRKVAALQQDLNRLLAEYADKAADKVAQEKISLQLGEREREIKSAIRDYQQETNLSAQEQIEIARLHLTSLARPLNLVEGTRLEILKLQTRQLVIQSELAPLLKKGIENLTPEERKRFEQLVHQFDLLDRQIGQKQKLIDQTSALVHKEDQVAGAITAARTANDLFVDSMARLFAEVSDVSKEWENFKLSVTAFGRADKELTDRELARKLQNTKGDIFQRQLALGQWSGPGQPYDPFLEQQKYNLAQLLGEINLRRDVRRTVATRGEDAAFSQFSGLTEQRFREILGSQTLGQAAVDELKELNRNQTRGFQALAENLKDIGRG